MDHKLTLIGTLIAVSAISIPFVITASSPETILKNCELPVNATREQIQELIDIGCSIDTSPNIWDKGEGIGNWTGTAELIIRETP